MTDWRRIGKKVKKLKDFFEKRKEAELFHKQIMEQLHVLTKEIQVEKNVLDALCKEVKQNGTDISRHDMALEDCLDMLEEWEKERAGEKKQRQNMEKEREKWMQMFRTYQEQLWSMKSYAEKNDDAWYQQILLVENVIQEQMLSCGITAIDKKDCMVNYEFHEVIELKDTEDVCKDKMVAVVYSPGYLYQGEVKQKAQVAAYHLRENA